MADMVWLYGVECNVLVGVPKKERSRRQKVVIDIGLETDTRAAAATDDFRLAVDYWAVEKAVREVAEKGERQLVETLAEDVAALVLSKMKAVKTIQVAVHKRPAVMPKTRDVVVWITRSRV